MTTKYGKELIKARMQEESQMEQSMLQEDVQPDPLERKRLSDPDRATRVKNEKSRCQYRMG